MCNDMGYIELDFKLVVDWLKKKFFNPWYLQDFCEGLENELQGINYTIKHQFRESNQVADWLARYGKSGIRVDLQIGENFCNG